MTHEARGVADVDGKTVFVDGALPGERVEWVRMRRKRNYDEARAISIIERSPARREPRCDVFGVCGGCVMQHLDDDAQLDAKHQVLVDNLQRIGGLAPARWLEPLAAEPWHYRRRARLGVRYVEAKQRVLVGFRERYKPYITDMQRCPVLVAPVANLIGPLAELIAGLSIVRRIPQIEVSVGDAEAGPVIAMIVRVLEPPAPTDIERLQAFSAAHDVWFSLQPGGPDSVAPLPRADGGVVPRLSYRLPAYDLQMHFEATDFIQVNARMNEKMVSQAIDLMDIRPADNVLDLYAGLGNFSLPIARSAASVHGVEGAAAMTARARQNAVHNGIDNASFATADLSAADRVRELLARGWDLVLLDPARAGAEAFAMQAAVSGARRIVYVSCHPGTLARDAGTLVTSQGYRLTAAGVMNMFPHTAHVESIAVFDRDQ